MPAADLDVAEVGAGFAGLYAVHALRSSGLTVRAFEAACGIGRTWFWNSYPGARCDVECKDYSYSFSPELEQEWSWSERYPAQPEILRYLNHVADRFGLRPDLQLNTRVRSAVWDGGAAESGGDDGRRCDRERAVPGTSGRTFPASPACSPPTWAVLGRTARNAIKWPPPVMRGSHWECPYP
jgi:hypothetical protein